MSIKKAMLFADKGDYKAAYETLLNFMAVPEEKGWLKEFNNLFPTEKDVYEVSGKPIAYSPRQSLTHVESRMKIFMKTYMAREFKEVAVKDRPEVILAATRLYIEERLAENYAFIKKSNKFINDNDGSVLFTYVKKYLEGDRVESSSHKAKSW